MLVPYPRYDVTTPSKRSSSRVATPIRTKHKEMLASARKTQKPLPMYCFSERMPVRRRLFVSPSIVPTSVKDETDDVLDEWIL